MRSRMNCVKPSLYLSVDGERIERAIIGCDFERETVSRGTLLQFS